MVSGTILTNSVKQDDWNGKETAEQGDGSSKKSHNNSRNIGNGIGKKMSGGGTTSSGDIEASVKNQDSGEGIGVSVQNTKSGPDINLQV